MKNTITAVLVSFGALMAATSAFAADVLVYGRAYTYSCGYYSAKEAEVHVTYRNTALPWGSRVSIIYGWGGIGQGTRYTWKDRNEVEAQASAPYEWRAQLIGQIASRGYNYFSDEVNYVIHVRTPDGRETYVNGGSNWGYYAAALGYVSDVTTCIDASHPKPDFRQLPVNTVAR